MEDLFLKEKLEKLLQENIELQDSIKALPDDEEYKTLKEQLKTIEKENKDLIATIEELKKKLLRTYPAIKQDAQN